MFCAFFWNWIKGSFLHNAINQKQKVDRGIGFANFNFPFGDRVCMYVCNPMCESPMLFSLAFGEWLFSVNRFVCVSWLFVWVSVNVKFGYLVI